jgi:prepilin-type N-terminal cleavage/methylation domain-containing protein
MARRVQKASCVVDRRMQGFTLVEMMVVVAIVAVLAVLAVAGYRRLVTTAHVSEATNMVQNIRVAQEGYHSETQTYANVSAALTTYYPQANPTENVVTGWGAPCGGACITDWSVLPIHVDGPVMFGYATVAGPAGTNPAPSTITVNGQPVNFPQPSTVDWFLIAASCDLDNDGKLPNTTVYTTSWSSVVMVDSEGN